MALVVGRVDGPYEWRENSPIPGMRHLLPVEWLGRIDWDDLDDDDACEVSRKILEITDPPLVALGDRAEAGDLLPVTPPTPVRRSRSIRTSSVRSARSDERPCEECFLWNNVSQFNGDSMICREHTA